MPSTVGIAAIRISPDSPALSELISSRMPRMSPTMRRAQSSVRSPSGVKPTKREPRCTSMTPRISSSCFRLVDIVGWVTPQASAAGRNAVPLPAPAEVQACRSRRNSQEVLTVNPAARGPRPAATNSTGRRAPILQKRCPGGLDFRGNLVLISPHSSTISASLRGTKRRRVRQCFSRHCEPTGRANARPMTGSAKQSIPQRGDRWIASSLCSSQ